MHGMRISKAMILGFRSYTLRSEIHVSKEATTGTGCSSKRHALSSRFFSENSAMSREDDHEAEEPAASSKQCSSHLRE